MPDKQAMHVKSWIFTLVRGIASCYRSNQQLCGDYEPQSKQYSRTLFAVQMDKKEYTHGVSGVPYRRLERGALVQKQKKGVVLWFYESVLLGAHALPLHYEVQLVKVLLRWVASPHWCH